MRTDPSTFLFAGAFAFILSIVIFFGSFLPNPHHPLDYLYGSLTALGLSVLCGYLYYFYRRQR